MSAARRSPTPPLRAPSPLGGRYIVATHDGNIRSRSPPVRSPASPVSPPTWPTPLRPPSPDKGGAPSPRSGAAELAKQTSRRELQKIDSQRLGSLLAETTEELGLLAGAFVEIQRKINQGYEIPPRVIKQFTSVFMAKLVVISCSLIKYLGAVSATSHTVRHYLTSHVASTHLGRHQQPIREDIKPVMEELKSLHSNWASLADLEAELGSVLREGKEALEQAMEPKRWVPGLNYSSRLRLLATAHVHLASRFVDLAAFFKDLTTGAPWYPPALSPDDFAVAAKQWQAVRHVAKSSSRAVRDSIKQLLEHSSTYEYLKREEKDQLMRKILAEYSAGKIKEH